MTTAPLRERAQAARQPDHRDHPSAAPPAGRPEPQTTEYTDPITTDPEQVPVHIAWQRLMRDVRNIQKLTDMPVGKADSRKTVRIRGINEVIAATSGALRRHGMFIAPADIRTTYENTRSAGNAPMRECTATVTYWVYGPAGDHFVAVGEGQAADSGDKAATKACRIAYRNAILDLLCAGTDAPDPEAEGFERGDRVITPTSYAQEILDERTSLGRLRQIRTELKADDRLGAVVTTPTGDMALGALIDHVGLARRDGRDPFPDTQPAGQADDPYGGADPDADEVQQ